MNKRLKAFLQLPPIEKRRMIGDPLRKKLFGDWTVENDETYVSYLTFKYGCWLGFAVSALIVALHLRGAYCPIFCLNNAGIVTSFLWRFPLIFFAVMVLILLPAMFVVLRANVDWHAVVAREGERRRHLKNTLAEQRTAIAKMAAFFYALTPGAGAIPHYFEYHLRLYQSEAFLLLCAVVLPILMALMGSWEFRMTVVYLQIREFMSTHFQKGNSQ